MTTQAMATQQNTNRAMAGPVSGFGSETIDGFSNADLEIPLLKLVHGTSKMEGAAKHGGEWWTSLMGFKDVIYVVILNEGFSRSLYRGDSGRSECMSYDGVNGTRYGKCSTCNFNGKFNPEAYDEGNERCPEGRRLLLYIPEDDSFALFIASKGNYAALKKLHSAMIFRYKIKEPYQALVKFAVAENDQPGKHWFSLLPSVERLCTPEEINGTEGKDGYRGMAVAAMSIKYRVVDEEPADESAQGEAPADQYGDEAPLPEEPAMAAARSTARRTGFTPGKAATPSGDDSWMKD